MLPCPNFLPSPQALRKGCLLPPLCHESAHRRRRISEPTPARGRRVQALDIGLPLGHVDALDAAVVRKEAVDLPLDVRRLGPHASAAAVELYLLAELVEEDVGAVVVAGEVEVDLVGLVDGQDGRLDIPETVSQRSGC